MKTLLRTAAEAAAIIIAVAQTASGSTLLYGTTGAGGSAGPASGAGQNSVLYQLDPNTGLVISTIGKVGYTVNGLAWDATSGTMYGSTSINDKKFHGLITIDLATGAGTPVDSGLVNFGLSGSASPIHSITIDSKGNMVAWYDESANPTDTFVTIDKHTGVATEFGASINTAQNGLSFDNEDRLWNIDSPDLSVGSQTAYQLSSSDGSFLGAQLLAPMIPAALGDFNPENDLYYGLSFNVLSGNPKETDFIEVNVADGSVRNLGRIQDGMHTLAFATTSATTAPEVGPTLGYLLLAIGGLVAVRRGGRFQRA